MPKWYVGCDHAGYKLKVYLINRLEELGDEVVDLGTKSESRVDYPDYGAKVARRVAASEGNAFGLLLCGTGIGISIAANKVPGARAAVVTDAFTAQASRAHNDANIISMGARVIGPGVAESALRVFRDSQFEGGRHEKRVAKIDALELKPAHKVLEDASVEHDLSDKEGG
jgi:ribose 5-phosphate isomerase B